MKRSILYLLLLLSMLYLMVMYNAPHLYQIFWGGVAFFLLNALLGRFLLSKIKADLIVLSSGCTEGEVIRIRVQIRNRGFLPVRYVRIRIKCRNLYGDAEEMEKITLDCEGRSETFVETELRPECCGMLAVRLDRLWVEDYLRLFRFSKPLTNRKTAFVYPVIQSFTIAAAPVLGERSAEGDVYVTRSGGMDPTEVSELREYRAGDRLQRIHWKMTAKSGEYVVKEFSSPKDYPLVVFLDLYYDSMPGQVMKQSSRTIAFLAAFSSSLLAAGIQHYLAWQDVDGEISRQGVGSEEELYGALRQVLPLIVYQQRQNWEEQYCQMFGEHSFMKFITIDTTLEIKADDRLIGQVSKDFEKNVSDIYLEIAFS